MIKIKESKTLDEYGEIIQRLNPVLTNRFVQDVQDYIENQLVEYSKEEIREEKFLQFVADKWPNEVEVEDVLKEPRYSFSLYDEDKPVIQVSLELGVNDEETKVMVSDIAVEVQE